MQNLNGIRDMIAFLNYLKGNSITYTIAHRGSESVMVTYTLYGVRVELDFFDDHIEYSYFTGNEDVETDQALLFAMIQEYLS